MSDTMLATSAPMNCIWCCRICYKWANTHTHTHTHKYDILL